MDLKITKYSRQRDIILRILRSTKCHPTADWIYEKVKKEIPNISLGTVYRNLNFLADKGKIRRFSFGGTTAQFDGDLRDHYHIRCDWCKRIEDVPHISTRISCQEIESLTGYRIHSLNLFFSGICPECQRKGEQ
ncbi:transcriptional repressor [bacterium]|nr:transcriptional repressor [bacterium]RQV98229.1 MAG: transcriptional repressor [bacterium]